MTADRLAALRTELAEVEMRAREAAMQAGAAAQECAAARERAASRPTDQTTKAEAARAEARLEAAHRQQCALDAHRARLFDRVRETEEQRKLQMVATSAVRAYRNQAEQTVVRDAEGFDLCPDPLRASTPGELVEAVRAFRIWAGEPSFREMAKRAGSRTAASTICTALGSEHELPRLQVVLAVIAGCGGSEDDQRRFATAWRRIRLGHVAAGHGQERPDLRVVPAAGAG